MTDKLPTPTHSDPRHQPNPSIESFGGTLPYLDATKDQHGGIDGTEFAYRVRVGVPDTRLARDMGVVVNTVKSWRKRLGEGVMAKQTTNTISKLLKTYADKYNVDLIVLRDNIPGVDQSILTVRKGDKEINIRFDTGTDYQPLIKSAIAKLQEARDD